MRLDRTNRNLFARWWWTVDRLTFFALVVLMLMGAVLVTAASPPVATRIGLDPFYFIHRQHFFLFIGLLVLFAVSLLRPTEVRRLAVFGFVGALAMMVLVPFVGIETKGAHRWLSIAGLSIQPSEFMKPCFAVVMAWVFSERHKTVGFPGFRVAIGLYMLVAALLLVQPDLGMTITVTAMWGVQIFMAGLPIAWVLVAGVLGIGALWMAYLFFPHVSKRIDSFLDPTAGDNYQVSKALDAFSNGGVMGRGPGEGQVKQFIPDSHTDFIFAVAGEEFGMLFSLLIVAVFAFIIFRMAWKIWRETDLFTMLAVTGLVTQFGVQAVINMGVAVNLFPAKGMTLPFLSYGGSSLLAIALGMGMMLALTRKRYGQ